MPLIHTKIDQSNCFHTLNTNSICPFCNTSILPTKVVNTLNEGRTKLYAIMRCPHCDNFYYEVFYRVNGGDYYSELTLPHPSPSIDIPTKIEIFYPDFYRIYLQAAKAEVAGLMGYRKSLETLVKHFACKTSPDETENILKESLGATINRLDSKQIQALARAATWLGNDQTHLVTKHPDYDLPELKAFIQALCQYILSEEEFQNALKLLNQSKKR